MTSGENLLDQKLRIQSRHATLFYHSQFYDLAIMIVYLYSTTTLELFLLVVQFQTEFVYVCLLWSEGDG